MEREEWENGGQPPAPVQQTEPAEDLAEPTEPEELKRRLAALQAENRRLQTQVFAYERAMLALRRENEDLEQRCEQLASRFAVQPEPRQVQAAEPVQQPLCKPQSTSAALAARAPGQAETQLERLSAELIEEFDRLMPAQK